MNKIQWITMQWSNILAIATPAVYQQTVHRIVNQTENNGTFRLLKKQDNTN